MAQPGNDSVKNISTVPCTEVFSFLQIVIGYANVCMLYFSVLESSNAHLSCLNHLFSNAMTEVYLFFYQAVLQIYVTMNKFLQREDLIITVMDSQIKSLNFMKKFMGRFVTIRAIIE